MKKIVTITLSLALLLSLCACSKTDTDAISMDQVGATIDFTPNTDFVTPTIETVTTSDTNDIELDLELVSPTIDSVTSSEVSDSEQNSGMNFSPFLSWEAPKIDAVTVGDTPTIELDLKSASEFDFSIEPVEVSTNVITFEFADYQYEIDVESFDVNQFAEDSAGNFSEEAKLELVSIDIQDIVTLAETRANLLSDLSHAFKSAGLAVTVNEELGEIMLDSTVLFAVDKSTISAEGKDFLQKFLAVYTTVVFNPKYEGFVSDVLVEGHTDSSGNYNYNLTLSQDRAESVLAFCLSEESGIDSTYIAALEETLEAVGYSCDKLIYDANGNEDKAASRRVSFRFLIALPN